MPDFVLASDRDKRLTERIARLGVKDKDVVERFIRSRGPGGQNVNKTSTCVYLKHIPTGIEVKYQAERSQALNRYFARMLLLDKIGALSFKKTREEKSLAEKLRRRERKRPRGLKERILREKKRQSEKKMLRARVREVE